jgi:hypothetical protein
MTGSEILAFAVVAICIGVASLLSFATIKSFKGDRFLCDDCQFNDPELCLKPERPKALECMAYQPRESSGKKLTAQSSALSQVQSPASQADLNSRD